MASAERARLETFVPPRVSPRLVDALVPLNRWLCLAGTPGLRDLPKLRAIPGFAGLCDVRDVIFDADEEDALADRVASREGVFLTPVHPEFFTDWMLDKELSARCAPRMLAWATHEIVNGTGRLAQKFWLANGLVAQIPGAGGAAGKAASIDSVLAGQPVLLHPEGQVGWHAHHVGPLFGGVAEMALEAAERATNAGLGQRIWIAPVAWKLVFTRDVDAGLHREADRVERTLGLPSTRGRLRDVAARMASIYANVLLRESIREGFDPNAAAGQAGTSHLVETAKLDGLAIEARRVALLDHLARRLVTFGAVDTASRDGETGLAVHLGTVRAAERWLRSDAGRASTARIDVRLAAASMRQQQRWSPLLYRGDTMTQEQVAENLKRLRCDLCRRSLRDTLHRFIPRPVGPRIAHVRLPEPIEVVAPREAVDDATRDRIRDALLADLRRRMQAAIDVLHAVHESVRSYPNPWR
jgi:hypothetical protein